MEQLYERGATVTRTELDRIEERIDTALGAIDAVACNNGDGERCPSCVIMLALRDARTLLAIAKTVR